MPQNDSNRPDRLTISTVKTEPSKFDAEYEQHDYDLRLDTALYAGLGMAVNEASNDSEREIVWQRFQHRFEHEHPGFLQRLTVKIPTLTKMEIRICAIARTDANSEFIAHTLRIKKRTLSNHRYRIRQKMQLVATDSFYAAIQAI